MFEEANFRRGAINSPQGSHSDYPINLQASRRFCENIQKSLLPGMRVYVNSSHGLKDDLLTMIFAVKNWEMEENLGMKEHIPNFANPISMHQSSCLFSKEIELTFNFMFKKAKEWWDKHPRKPQESSLNELG